MLLTVEKEKTDQGEVAICFDSEGLDLLLATLSALRYTTGYAHVMAPAWGGTALTEIAQGGDRFELCNHLRLVRSLMIDAGAVGSLGLQTLSVAQR